EAFLRQRLGPDSRDLYAETHRELDRLLLPRVLDYTGGNQHPAALPLGIAPQTLRPKPPQLGLRAAPSVGAHGDGPPHGPALALPHSVPPAAPTHSTARPTPPMTRNLRDRRGGTSLTLRGNPVPESTSVSHGSLQAHFAPPGRRKSN